MAPETQPLQFECYNCKAENFYPVVAGKENEGGKTVVKRCTTCSVENRIELPDGWIAAPTQVLFRGTKKEHDSNL